MFILSKIFGFLINPLLWIFLLLIWAASCKQKKRQKKLIWVSAIALFIFSNSFLVGWVVNAYEAKYPKLEKYDVGIVLGGFSELNLRDNSIMFNSSGDRLFQAIKLYETGVIQKILISSGNANLLGNKVKEADLAAAYLKEIGIPDSAILIENKSRNTIENARNSTLIISKKYRNPKILVATSAWHIPRARLIFDKVFKTNLTYYPTNFAGKTSFAFSEYIIPSATALNKWNILLKEWAGLVVDRWRISLA